MKLDLMNLERFAARAGDAVEDDRIVAEDWFATAFKSGKGHVNMLQNEPNISHGGGELVHRQFSRSKP